MRMLVYIHQLGITLSGIMFKRRRFIKPVDTTEWCEWIVIELNIITNFIDDWKRYGFSIALWNMWFIIKNKRGIHEEIKDKGGI